LKKYCQYANILPICQYGNIKDTASNIANMGRNIWQYIAKMYEVFCTFLHASKRQKSMLTSNQVFLDSSHQGLSESVKKIQKYFFLQDLPRKLEKYLEKIVRPPGIGA
jgi:ATP-dependent Lon protease